ncbi:hypothetical protein SARC_06118 [Sphaeroforma arctica JP610]|uniref:Uncharacterized protein n=1 Tax=Sphaeroforma arctica JP610 TaxID=667725 RepID=A0A0L0FYE8_9EUKA|nr:hypothetical protein SARC_06118 [Sphaeroforma arctica JP610]KNC81561.1 hypothetical protein SARC_06118 [Sphaeroforma arctica JP610]|eukprot:XP_014155463.1 hypothetical protein SARC_06118 [Sphaeroforma arctica JP610]
MLRSSKVSIGAKSSNEDMCVKVDNNFTANEAEYVHSSVSDEVGSKRKEANSDLKGGDDHKAETENKEHDYILESMDVGDINNTEIVIYIEPELNEDIVIKPLDDFPKSLRDTSQAIQIMKSTDYPIGKSRM